MRDNPYVYSLPRWRLMRWLADAGRDAPDDIRIALIGTLYGSWPIFIGGLVNTIAVAALIAIRIPEPPIVWWLVFALAICLARLAVFDVARRAAWEGRETPTDMHLLLALAWAASPGIGALLCLLNGDWVASTIACLSAAGMVAGICLRNFAAPRLTAVMIVLALTPICIGAPFTGEAIMYVTFLQLPAYVAAMTAAAFHLNKMMVATMRAERENGFRALHDGLTGLSNRHGLEQAMEVIRAAPGATWRVGLLYLDLDEFKAVNDAHGHAVGDDLLVSVGERLKAILRPDDCAARIGGDEFVILSRDRSRAALLDLGDDLIVQLSKPYSSESGELSVGVSVGLALSADHGVDLASLMHAADGALYRSKSLGKGRCTLASRKGAEPERGSQPNRKRARVSP